MSEFARPGIKPEINVGDSTEVFIENIDNANGETLLSREKAVKQKAWHNLQDSLLIIKLLLEFLLIELRVV